MMRNHSSTATRFFGLNKRVFTLSRFREGTIISISCQMNSGKNPKLIASAMAVRCCSHLHRHLRPMVTLSLPNHDKGINLTGRTTMCGCAVLTISIHESVMSLPKITGEIRSLSFEKFRPTHAARLAPQD
jgi:hypothetical protein